MFSIYQLRLVEVLRLPTLIEAESGGRTLVAAFNGNLEQPHGLIRQEERRECGRCG